MTKCLFCDIINHRESSAVVYEDEEVVAIMDRFPIARGHVLVLPRRHLPTLLDMSEKEVGELFQRVRRLALAVQKATGAEGLNVGQNNGVAARQLVPHVHVHIIPRFRNDSPEGGFPSRQTMSLAELTAVAEDIRSHTPPA